MKKRLINALLAGVVAASVFCGCSTTVDSGDSSSVTGDVNYDLEYAMAIPDINDLGHEISPFIYGEFLEHIPGCIYGVIWAELLMDRKFYYPAGEDGLSPWVIEGDVTNSEEGYSVNGYAPVLRGGGVISQSVKLVENDYSAYFYAEGQGRLVVKIGEEERAFDVEGSFKKYQFNLTVARSDEFDVQFKCVSGEVKIDSLSLMPADNYKGMRRDSLDAMKSLGGTIYRWPGGNFVSGYNWKDGVGDRDKRPCVRNRAWFPDNGNIESDKAVLSRGDFYGRIDPNDMGTDEFIAMCQYIGATPYLAVNSGTGSVQDAVDYVNYCNGEITTEYGALRAKNGYNEPYGIKYWCIGNEMQGSWQIGHMPIDEYVSVHNRFVEQMRLTDPSIIVSGCGDNSSMWSEGMFESCAANMDYIAEHLYADRSADFTTQVQTVLTLNNFQSRIDKHRQLMERYPAGRNVKIAFDEYAMKWNGQPNLRDAICIAAVLNLFIKNADVVGMANYSDAIFINTKEDAPGALYAYTDRVEFSPIGYVLQAYASHMQNYPLIATIRETERTNIQYQATVSADKKTVALAISNPSNKSIKISLRGTEADISKHISIVGKSETAEGEDVAQTVIESPTSLILQPLSVNVAVFEIV